MKSNPLSTRFVEPGKLAWRSLSDLSLAELAARFTQDFRWRAAVVGPHGSGKSTFLESFVPLLGSLPFRAATYELYQAPRSFPSLATAISSGQLGDRQQRRITWLKMRGGAESRRLLFRTYRQWAGKDSLLVIDGYEQLSRPARGAALLLTRLNGAGLLLTSHRPTALRTLIETRTDVGLATELLEELLPEDLAQRDYILDSARLERLLAKHQGNLREVFMELYDEL